MFRTVLNLLYYPENAPFRIFHADQVVFELQIIRKLGQQVDAKPGAALELMPGVGGITPR